jgi:hypothetical protein
LKNLRASRFTAGSIVDRVKKEILKDKQFRSKLAGIKKIISKS